MNTAAVEINELPDGIQAGMGYMEMIVDDVEDGVLLRFGQRLLLALARLFAWLSDHGE